MYKTVGTIAETYPFLAFIEIREIASYFLSERGCYFLLFRFRISMMNNRVISNDFLSLIVSVSLMSDRIPDS